MIRNRNVLSQPWNIGYPRLCVFPWCLKSKTALLETKRLGMTGYDPYSTRDKMFHTPSKHHTTEILIDHVSTIALVIQQSTIFIPSCLHQLIPYATLLFHLLVTLLMISSHKRWMLLYRSGHIFHQSPLARDASGYMNSHPQKLSLVSFDLTIIIILLVCISWQILSPLKLWKKNTITIAIKFLVLPPSGFCTITPDFGDVSGDSRSSSRNYYHHHIPNVNSPTIF